MEFLSNVVDRLREAGIRTSIFVGTDADNIRAAARAGADRVELYTKPYADEYPRCPEDAVAPFVEASRVAHQSGHDLNLENLRYFHESLPYLNEVSIGHAIICDALYLGIEETIRRYKECLGRTK